MAIRMLSYIEVNILTLWHQVLCGRRPCRLESSGRDQSCPAGRECLQHSYFTCFSPPCHQWGVCSMVGPPPPQATTKCQPNSGHLDNSCGRITLVFNRDKVPPVSNQPHIVLNRLNYFLCCFWLMCFGFLCLSTGNNSGEYLFWAEVSSWY